MGNTFGERIIYKKEKKEKGNRNIFHNQKAISSIEIEMLLRKNEDIK